MDILIKLVGILGSIFIVKGLFTVATGLEKFLSAKKNDNPQQMDQGIDAMISGGVLAAISGGLTAGITTVLGQIKF